MSGKPALTLADYRRHKELRPLLAQSPWCAERDEFYKIERKWDALPNDTDFAEHALERAEKAEAILAQLEKTVEDLFDNDRPTNQERRNREGLRYWIDAARAQVEKDFAEKKG